MKLIKKLISSRLLVAGWILSTSFYASGCCCTSMIDFYGDGIDGINDHLSAVDFDRFYHPEWDVSRIGQPDWCRSRLNQKLCPQSCGCQTCKESSADSHHNGCLSCESEMHCNACESTLNADSTLITEDDESSWIPSSASVTE